MNQLAYCPKEDEVAYQKLEWVARRDGKGRPDLRNLLHVFQEAAGRQIERLHIGKEFQRQEKFLYVVCRVKGVFSKEVKEGEKLLLVTYALPSSSIQSDRYCYLLNEKGEAVFALSSLWVYRDPTTRRRKPVRKAKEQRLKYAPDAINLDPLPGFDRLTGIELSKDEDFKPAFTHTVGKEDIDENGHRNNTIYLGLAQEALNTSFASFEINFEKECRLGEKLILSVTDEGEVKGVKEDGTLSFKAKFGL